MMSSTRFFQSFDNNLINSSSYHKCYYYFNFNKSLIIIILNNKKIETELTFCIFINIFEPKKKKII